MDNRINLPIAVLDSGVGGISVLRELVKIMPEEHFIYFGDSKNAPYGTKSRTEVLEITKSNLEFLKKRGIKAFVVACNTATSAAVKILREENPDLIIVGIEPAVKPASLLCEHPRVLVMATPLTLKEEKFKNLVARFENGGEFIPLPCPGLADLIETGDVEGDQVKRYLYELFSPYLDEKIDGIVLGCTHYPHVRSIIDEIWGGRVAILDGGEGTARETRRRLAEKSLLGNGDGKIEIFNTSDDEKMIEISKKLLYK
jgi:glutamate racemase